MDPRVHDYAAGEEVASADLNNIQDAALGIDQAKYLWVTRPTLGSDGGIVGTATIFVGDHRGLVMGSEVVLPPAGNDLVATTGLTAGWWYVYAYNNAGAVEYELSSTAPDISRAFKAGDATRRYVGCFKVYNDGSNLRVPAFRAVNGRYFYRSSAIAFAFQKVLDDGTATGAGAAVSLAAAIPPHASFAMLRARTWKESGVGGTNYVSYLVTYGDSAGFTYVLEASGPASTETISTWQHLEIQPGSNAGVLSITYANDFATTHLRLWVTGFVEE